MTIINNRIRVVAKDIVIAFAQHIKRQIADRDRDYIALGVDATFSAYERFFKAVAVKALGLNMIPPYYPNMVIVETLDVVDEVIRQHGYERELQNPATAQAVYEVCLFVLKRVREDEFTDDLLQFN